MIFLIKIFLINMDSKIENDFDQNDIKYNNNAFRYECGECNRLYASRSGFYKHISICKDKLKCKHCGKYSRSLAVSNKHKQNCLKSKKVVKCVCGKTFYNNGNRTNHRKKCIIYQSYINIEYINCVCGSLFLNEENHSEHQKLCSKYSAEILTSLSQQK